MHLFAPRGQQVWGTIEAFRRHMASNLQEITMLSKRMCAGGHSFVQNALVQLKEKPLSEDATIRLESAVRLLGRDLHMLEEVIAYFSFSTQFPG